jgi:ribosomal-protein-alanine N-acetyltransferase
VEEAGIKLRSYRVDDLDAMHALDIVCFDLPFRFTRSAMRRFAEAKKARLVIAEESGALAGFVILHLEHLEEGRVGYIVTLDVAPDQRRRGIARQLMRKAEMRAREDDCAALVLHVFTGNETAIRFYITMGFVRSHREEEFYGPGMDAWVFHKLLPRMGE